MKKFFQILLASAATGVVCVHLGNAQPAGTVDTAFLAGLAGANDAVESIAVQNNGQVLIGGWFTSVNSASRNRIARINTDGSLDTTFGVGLAGANGTVKSVILQNDGKVLIGGVFTSINDTARNRIARINTDGSLDTTFGVGLAGANDAIESVAVQSDGKVLIGGAFTSVNETNRNRIARLNSNGSLDTNFVAGLTGANDAIESVAVQSDGKVLIGGWFTSVNGSPRNRIARLNDDGSLDTSFGAGITGANDAIESVAVQSDGKVLIGGWFTSVNGSAQNRIARLNSDGSLDTNFGAGLAGANGTILSVTIQDDGKVLIGGEFTRVNGVIRNRIARLKADGSLDTGFGAGLAGANGAVESVIFRDGKVLIGGFFTSVNDVSHGHVARLFGACPPEIVTEPQSRINNAGTVATFTVTASGTELPSYRWRKDDVDLSDGGNVSGATTRALILDNVQAGDAASYTVVVTNSFGAVTSAVATLTVQAALPAISSQPQSRTNIAGTNVTFTVATTGTDPRSYQWRRNDVDLTNGGNVSGATTTTLTLTSVQPADAASYTVVITNSLGAVTSAVATLTVLYPPIVINGPTNQTVMAGADVTFTVTADGSTPLNYQWKFNGINLVNGANVSGATSNFLVLSNVQFTQQGTYALSITNVRGSVITSAVLEVLSPPIITQEPQSRTNLGGATVTFSVAVTGTTNFNYQWQKDMSGVWTNLTNGVGVAGATTLDTPVTTNTLTLSDMEPTDGEFYRVVVTNNFGVTNSAVVTNVVRQSLTLGDVDTTFDGGAGPKGSVYAIARQRDSKTIIGGDFSTLGGVARSNVARLNPTSSLDTSFLSDLSGANRPVYAVAIQVDSKVIIGGAFGAVNGEARSFVARLNANGSLDPDFGDEFSGANDFVRSVAIRSDGHVLIGGEFTTVSGVTRKRIACLKTNGTLDINFLAGLAGANNTVNSLAVQSDGKVLIGGAFTSINGTNRNRIARLNDDGSLDTNFLADLPGANDAIESVAVQSDGKVLIGGWFTNVNNVTRNRIARLNSNGSLDANFLADLPGANGTVYTIAVESDGKVLIGGAFTSVNGTNRNRIARLNPDGSLDTAFGDDLAGANGTVYAISALGDGRILIGGAFTSVNKAPCSHFARLLGALSPAISLIQPAQQTRVQGETATFSVTAAGAKPFHYQWRFAGSPISGATSSNYTIAAVQTNNAGDYSVVVTNYAGSVTSSIAALNVALHTKAPLDAQITAPPANWEFDQTNNVITVSGKAIDTVRISRVWVKLNGSSWQEAAVTNLTPTFALWTNVVTLAPGTNTVYVKCVDFAGNESLVASRSFFLRVTNALTLNINPSNGGTVTGVTNGQPLYLGRSYTATAKPNTAGGHLYINWVSNGVIQTSSILVKGSPVVTSAKLTFLMTSNLVLEANFVTNRFIGAAGNYCGLFSETIGVTHQSAGFITFKTDSKLAFSGKLYVAGEGVSFSGINDLGGMGTLKKPAVRKGLTNEPIYILSTMNLEGGNVITGTLTSPSNGWTAEFTAYKQLYSLATPPPARGLYTIILPGTNNGVSPFGDGYALINVQNMGVVKAHGYFGDGEQVKVISAQPSANGHWPFYAYACKFSRPATNPPTSSGYAQTYNASVLGWLTFTNSSVEGDLFWNKTGWTNGFYDAGFTNKITIIGSAYTNSGGRVVAFSKGMVALSGGNLSATITNDFDWTDLNKLVFDAAGNPKQIKLSVPASSGKLSGSFLSDNPTPSTPIYGVVLQSGDVVRGFFRGTNQTGSVLIQQAQ